MSETQTYLKERWSNELTDLHKKISASLKSGKLNPKDLPKTEEGYIDLRGFSAPKEFAQHKSNSGNSVKYVQSSIRIKGQVFENFDLSFSDFEKCSFWNCKFTNTKFNKSRFKACNFNSCAFTDLSFETTDLAFSTFGKSLFKFKTPIITGINFIKANLSECHFIGIEITNCSIVNCKTGALIISKSLVNGLRYEGELKNLFILENKKLENLNFEEAEVIDLQVRGSLENSNELLQSIAVKGFML